MNVYLLRY